MTDPPSPIPRDRTYVIEAERGGGWTLRRFGVHQPMAVEATLAALRGAAFDRLREFAPCRIRVLWPFAEWELEAADGEWTQVSPGPDDGPEPAA